MTADTGDSSAADRLFTALYADLHRPHARRVRTNGAA